MTQDLLKTIIAEQLQGNFEADTTQGANNLLADKGEKVINEVSHEELCHHIDFDYLGDDFWDYEANESTIEAICFWLADPIVQSYLATYFDGIVDGLEGVTFKFSP